eukprot:TRINITY_DN1261_c0_g1_i1.p1 TRINITY_DN1261_c0_g1~~TRINITY_DN1261_c0_g1_i1.p1  ORF type:complete len:318 (-),score=47.42 TRINITY_DN1261_c0_g1_i1:343-1296(-)
MGCSASTSSSDGASSSNAFNLPCQLVLKSRVQETHDVISVLLALPGSLALPSGGYRPLSSDVCYALLLEVTDAAGQAVMRPYTPVSMPRDDAVTGHVKLAVKVYPNARFGGALASMEVGSPITLKSIISKFPLTPMRLLPPANAGSLPDPPRTLWPHVTFLAGGTGITPCWQAVQYLLNPKAHNAGLEGADEPSPMPTRRISLLFFAHGHNDFLLQKDINAVVDAVTAGAPMPVAGASPVPALPGVTLDVLTITSDSAHRTNPRGALEGRLPAPGPDAMVMICGPPAFYDGLCGPRGQPVGGMLKALGYDDEMVYKF